MIAPMAKRLLRRFTEVLTRQQRSSSLLVSAKERSPSPNASHLHAIPQIQGHTEHQRGWEPCTSDIPSCDAFVPILCTKCQYIFNHWSTQDDSNPWSPAKSFYSNYRSFRHCKNTPELEDSAASGRPVCILFYQDTDKPDMIRDLVRRSENDNLRDQLCSQSGLAVWDHDVYGIGSLRLEFMILSLQVLLSKPECIIHRFSCFHTIA
jgi:hypothetical protein